MCGIAGFLGKGNIDDLQRMCDALLLRGPDQEGMWIDEQKRVFFGHRRLNIIDLATGNQPMQSYCENFQISFNGEIYNYKELRNELKAKGHIFRTQNSDTEVLLNGYKEWGDTLPQKLNGMWAFAIYDIKQKQIFFSRDRFGKKPLFYTFQNNSFVFASELTAIKKHSSVTLCQSSLSLKKYFAYGYIPAPNTLYEKIYKLPAGHNLLLQLPDLSFKISKYWDFVLEPFDTIPANAEERWCEELRDLLDKSVQRRLMSDVPLGIFLSGGVDSSAIAYYAKKNSIDKIKTFSIGFDDQSFDESYYSNKVAKLLGTEHTNELFSLATALSLLPDIKSKLDEPMGDSSLLPTFLLSKLTKQHVTVALGGDGADELFAGYDPFLALKYATLYNSLVPKPIHSAITLAVNYLPTTHKNMSFDFKLKRTLRGLSHNKKLWNSIWLGPLCPNELNELFNEPINIEDVYSEAIEQWDACRQNNIVDKTLQFYTKLYLQDDILVKVDRASMMNSLEVRAPFLDIDFVNLARQIPYNYKIRNGQTKYILKKALEPILPKEILYRSKKGFGIPIGKWFKEQKITLAPISQKSLLQTEFIERKLQEHIGRKADNRSLLWNMMLLNT
jgi:asparagine synthase (glutamine-hydrolysing)